MACELPDYSTVTPDELAQACRAAVEDCDARIAELVAIPSGQRTFENTVLALEEARAAVKEARAAWGFLAEVAPGEGLRAASQVWGERLDKHMIGIGLDEQVFQAVHEYKDNARAAALSEVDARLLEELLRGFQRSGIDLPTVQRDRLRTLLDELVELGSGFAATLAGWRDGIVVDRNELDGLSETFIEGLERVGEGYWVSLDNPEYWPFMCEARSAERRRELLEKNLRKGGVENVARLERALAVRQEIAGMLGYSCWAAYVLETRMAKTPEVAAVFLDDLRARIAPKVVADLAEMAEANVQAGGSREMPQWEQPYAISRLKQTRYAFDDAEAAQYLPLEACLEGLFATIGAVLGVRFEEVTDASVWHPEVRTFDVVEAAQVTQAAQARQATQATGGAGSAGGAPFGRFHLDLYPRPDKYKHAMALALRPGRRVADGSWQQPVAVMLANLTRPSADTPSLLRHAELVTLFHEFGHVLHEVLARAEHLRHSGAETEIDFVEAPSQMLEHWCWEPAVLGSFARHYRTGEPMPNRLLNGLAAAKTAASGVLTMQQLAFATLDAAYHSAGYSGDSTATYARVYAQHGDAYVEGTHLQSGITHLFGYDAAYYSYLWSKVLGDDMYTRFQQAGPLDPATGAHYRRTVLERGGSVGGVTMVRDFLGRDPSNEAFLRDIGL
ncbi:M3 family metallopeptidase [Catenulispora yoronensis]